MLRPENIKDEGRIVLNYGQAGCACDDLQILIRKRIREMQPLMRHGREVIMQYTLKNEILEMTADTHGAEILSVTRGGKEYIWNGAPEFWGRRTPILFPFVGQVRGGGYRHNNVRYPMGQHGFARDEEFEMGEKTEDSISFVLRDNERTRSVYPFSFALTVTYTLQGDTVIVEWNVRNTGDEILYFSIGAHPAFFCPVDGKGSWADYAIEIRKDGQPLSGMRIRPIQDGGNVGDVVKEIALDRGRITPTQELFSHDALILEGEQADEVSLIDPDGHAYVTVGFDTPLVGIWSPALKNAPFICIEPWCGRTDSVHFSGELSQREYGNQLNSGEQFHREYSMKFL